MILFLKQQLCGIIKAPQELGTIYSAVRNTNWSYSLAGQSGNNHESLQNDCRL